MDQLITVREIAKMRLAGLEGSRTSSGERSQEVAGKNETGNRRRNPEVKGKGCLFLEKWRSKELSEMSTIL